jgi:hypothetical protein
MLANFVVIIRVLPVQELAKTNNFLMSLFPTIIIKEIFGRNVALTSFMGRITTVVVKR